MTAPTNAPACFAAASVFSHDSDICARCCAFQACADASLETLEQIKGLVNVKDLLARHAKVRKVAQVAMKEADAKVAAALPPGNIKPALTKPVERKTQVVQVKLEPDPADEQIIVTLPVKAQKIALALSKSGMLQRIKHGVAEGRNALAESGPAWLRVTIDRLLAGGFSRSELREALQNELGWADTSAAPHVSMACALLLGFRVAQESDGRVVLAPATA